MTTPTPSPQQWSPEHTPEPWHTGSEPSGTQSTVFGGRGGTMLRVCGNPASPYMDDEERFANADRIVACVNACKGIPDPAALVAERDAFAARGIAEMALRKSLQEENTALRTVLREIDSMPVDGCPPTIIESMLRQAKSRAFAALTAAQETKP